MADTSHRGVTYYKEAILKKEGRSKWTEYYAVLTGCHLVFTKQDKHSGQAVPHNRTSLELSRRTVCGYSRKTCYRFPFYVQTDRGTYYFKCETNLQRYRWIYAIRLASGGKSPEAPPKFIPMKSPRRAKNGHAPSSRGEPGVHAARGRENHASHNHNNNNNNNNTNNNNNNVVGRRVVGNGNARDYHPMVPVVNRGARPRQPERAVSNSGYIPDPSDSMTYRSTPHDDWQLHSCSSSSSSSEDTDADVSADRGVVVAYSGIAASSPLEMDCSLEDLESDSSDDPMSRRTSVISSSSTRCGSRSEEAIGSRRMISGSSAMHLLSQESVASAAGRHPTRSFAMFAPTRYSDTMKSQSWTSVRSPINTTRRRESSAPSLRFSRHCEEIAELS